MIIFITGPSGVGKSTLRDYYCKMRNINPLSAYTTRESRIGEIEIHKTISEKEFEDKLKNGELCLVATNHGFNYGYSISEIKNNSKNIIIFEVDSKTAIKEKDILNAKIVRIIPSDLEWAKKIIIEKRDDSNDRTLDLISQTQPSFIIERENKGDIIFTNHYDLNSLKRFILLIDEMCLIK